MNRHDLVYVNPAAWRTLIGSRVELSNDAIVTGWVDRGWPLVVRRTDGGEGQGVPLGLPLPPSAGKRRLAFMIEPADVVGMLPCPSIASAIPAAPQAWRRTLLRLDDLAKQCKVEARLFGSLAWQAITGLDYLTDRSDLDFALHVRRDTRLCLLTGGVARIEADAPMRLDGELIRGGSAVNWRELHAGAREVLVKSIVGITLLKADQFLAGRMPA
jgi:phosphoribosyl-dephospho-CoA transferase